MHFLWERLNEGFFFFFIYDVVGRLLFVPLGKEAIEKLCRCMLILAGMSMHCDTELPVWQPRTCNIVCHWGRWWWNGPSHWNAPLQHTHRASLCNILLVKELDLLLFSKILVVILFEHDIWLKLLTFQYAKAPPLPLKTKHNLGKAWFSILSRILYSQIDYLFISR